MKRQLAYQIGYVIAAVAFGAPASAAGIATVTDVVNDGYRTPPGHEEQTAKRADELVQNEALRTDDESSIQVTFVDGSELRVEAESEMVLSDYVFDGAASKGLINLNDGLFHFTSNGKPDQGVKLKTPVATIGVRGTEFLVHVDGNDVDDHRHHVGRGRGEAERHRPSDRVRRRPEHPDRRPERGCECGDLGSFSAASGSPDHDRRPEPGHGGQDRERPKQEKAEPPKPDPEPEPDPDQGENSGSNVMLFTDEEPFELG